MQNISRAFIISDLLSNETLPYYYDQNICKKSLQYIKEHLWSGHLLSHAADRQAVSQYEDDLVSEAPCPVQSFNFSDRLNLHFNNYMPDRAG